MQDRAVALQALDAHYQSMPPSAAMQLQIAAYDGDSLHLHAPLAANFNDKGCAFGGSLTSLMTLAGWGLVSLHVQAAGLAADVFVADSEVRYRAPLWDDLKAEARLAEGEDWTTFIATLRERGRARIATESIVRLPEGGIATQCRARYVAIAKG